MHENILQKVKIQITKKVFVYVEATKENISLDDRVYAINWFNTKSLWLYNFYNFLATSQVNKIGGRGIFKGKTIQTLYGNDKDARDVVLIVTYPNISQFKKLLEMFSFKLVSLLRMLAVKDFTFGFTQKTERFTIEDDGDKNALYAMHHYKSEDDIFQEVLALSKNTDVNIFYSGMISALLYDGDEQRKQEQVPCLMDGVLILRSKEKNAINKLVQSKEYNSIIDETKSSYIATLNRIL